MTILRIRRLNKDYGYRRIHAMLRRNGIRINHKKVQRILGELNLQVKTFGRNGSSFSTYRGTVGEVASDRISRRFTSTVPHQKITTDTTEFRIIVAKPQGGFEVRKVYLDPYMDMFNNEIVSYTVSLKPPDKESMVNGLRKAVEATDDCIYRRTFHSDQGWAYQMREYRKMLKDNRIFQSMSRKGNCLDNSPMENFFGIMKQEMFYNRTFSSVEALVDEIERYISYYNNDRIKKRLNWMSPIQYRLNTVA